jgi:hypothetical protein
MPAINAKAPLAGKPGPAGPTGTTGSSWTTNDAPSDGSTYGRAPGSWIPALPLTGGTLASGILWANNVSSGPTNCSTHIVLGSSSNIGLCILGSTLNYYASYTKLYLNGLASFSIGSGASTSSLSFGDTGYYLLRYTVGPQFDMGSFLTWVPGRFDFWLGGNGIYCVGELWVADVGVKPYTSTFTNGNNWRWDGTWMLTRIDNAVEYPVAVACDERMKQDIEPSKFDALETIRKVRLYQYRWLDHGFPGRVRRDPDAPLIPIGLIAQRLYEDFPHAVKTGGVFKGAKLLWTPERLTLLATLCRAVQQLDERLKVLRDA